MLFTSGYGAQKNFAGHNLVTGRVGLNIKEDEVTSSEEALKERTSGSEGMSSSNTGEYYQFASVDTDLKSRLELPIISESPRTNRPLMDIPYLSLFPAENVYESAAKLLFIAIKWARTIPSFLQVTYILKFNSISLISRKQLSYRDQSILLEESWSELFVLTSAQWAFNVDEGISIITIVSFVFCFHSNTYSSFNWQCNGTNISPKCSRRRC